ncbi:hypothetical protein ACOSQ3_018765 [Xanthoceras sorbifolium]
MELHDALNVGEAKYSKIVFSKRYGDGGTENSGSLMHMVVIDSVPNEVDEVMQNDIGLVNLGVNNNKMGSSLHGMYEVIFLTSEATKYGLNVEPFASQCFLKQGPQLYQVPLLHMYKSSQLLDHEVVDRNCLCERVWSLTRGLINWHLGVSIMEMRLRGQLQQVKKREIE